MSTRRQRVITQKNIEEAMAANAARNGTKSLSARKKAAKAGFNSELFYRWFNRKRPTRATRRTIKDFGVGSERNADAWPSAQARDIPPELLRPEPSTYGVQPYGRRRGNLSAREAQDDANGLAELRSAYFKSQFGRQMRRGNPMFYNTIGATPEATVIHAMTVRPLLPFKAMVRESVDRFAFPPPRMPKTRRKHKALTESVKRRIQAEAAAEQEFLEAAATALKAAPSVANLEEKYRRKK